jgi:hypothetical protein
MRKITVKFCNFLENAPKKTKQDAVGWACNTYGGEDEAFGFLVGKPEGKITLRKARILLK